MCVKAFNMLIRRGSSIGTSSPQTSSSRSQDDHPVPKIIDFGVAKAISQPLTQHTLYTSLAGFVGTPEYMSPEQAELGGDGYRHSHRCLRARGSSLRTI